MTRNALILMAFFTLSGCGGEDDGGGGGGPEADAGACIPVTESITPPAGATLKFMDPCTVGQDAECETGLCYNFNQKGPHCSAACSQPCECPAPSVGCNNMGICKAP